MANNTLDGPGGPGSKNTPRNGNLKFGLELLDINTAPQCTNWNSYWSPKGGLPSLTKKPNEGLSYPVWLSADRLGHKLLRRPEDGHPAEHEKDKTNRTFSMKSALLPHHGATISVPILPSPCPVPVRSPSAFSFHSVPQSSYPLCPSYDLNIASPAASPVIQSGKLHPQSISS